MKAQKAHKAFQSAQVVLANDLPPIKESFKSCTWLIYTTNEHVFGHT